MQPSSSESATLPRDFRFHYQDGEGPKTPEPPTVGEPQQPPAPKGPRLRVKRRHASQQFTAPTEQFLASVAAADIPVPTIEVPQTYEDETMLDRETTAYPMTGFLSPQSLAYGIEPPHTPLPKLFTTMEDNSYRRPDWYMGATSTTDDGLSRPSSSMSNPSDWSDESFYSGSRISRPSDDGSCTSPESDAGDPFVSVSKGKGRETGSDNNTILRTVSTVLNGRIRSKTRNDAPWSKDMSEHLWQTYQVYLQDPTVTPFRIGASAVPPEGVIHRVAREARRSWKGPKTQASRQLRKRHGPSLNVESYTTNFDKAESPDDTTTSNSGSITPTGETVSRVYLQWQHSGAATRHHLRALCKHKNTLSVQRHRHFQSRSPTPFTQTRVRTRDILRTPNPSHQSSFSTEDIAMSLATSTSVSMQPDGPLAKLTEASATSEVQAPTKNQPEMRGPINLADFNSAPSRRLGSPFTAQTYGPSSSNSLSAFAPQRGHIDPTTTAGLFRRSPLEFSQPRSLNGTMKRRAQHAFEDELSPNGAVIRPSILDEQLFGGPLESHQRRVRSRGFSLGDAALGNRVPGLLPVQVDGTASPPPTETSLFGTASTARPITPLLPPVEFNHPRLGSPFTEAGTSNTFPRRLFQQADTTATIRKRPFATVHHTRRSIESFDFGDGPSLQSRLSKLDEKLAEIREREATASKPLKD